MLIRRFCSSVLSVFLQVHHEDLVALQAPFAVVALEGDFFPVRAKICLGIIASVGKLLKILQVFLVLCGQNGAGEQKRQDDPHEKIFTKIRVIPTCGA